MRFGDFLAMVADNSASGDSLVFMDSTDPAMFCTDPARSYEAVPYIGKSDMTIALKPNDDANDLDRDTFIGLLRGLRCRPRLKCQLAIYADESNWRGYLTDNLWSHMEPGGQSGTFYLDNPLDPNAVEDWHWSYTDNGGG